MLQLIVKPKALKDAAMTVISDVLMNTNKGIDKNGQPFEPYSTRPFAMPLGAFFAINTKRSWKEITKDGQFSIHRSSRSGRFWITIKGGYAYFKRLRFPTADTTVNLQVRGMRGHGMLSGLMIVDQDETSITVGFQDPALARLASYHCLTGAGKKRVIRDFMGITPEQRAELAAVLVEGVKVKFTNEG